MAQTASHNLSTEVADAIMAQTSGFFSGRMISRTGDTLSIYGSKSDLAAFAELITKSKRGGIAAADAATQRQITYLRDLLRTENGRLSGVTVADWNRLTRDEASRLINVIKGWA